MLALGHGKPADLAGTVNHGEAQERPVLLQVLDTRDTNAIHGVAGVGLKPSHAVDLGSGHRAARGGNLVVVHNVQALLDVQRAGLAIVAQAVVIVYAVGHVAGLLGFQNERTGLDGVHGTGVDLEEVALVDGRLVQQLAPAAPLDHLREFGAVVGALPHDDRGTRLAIEHVPALALAEAAVLMLGGVRVIGMHLDREVAVRVEDLDEQREAVAGGAGKERVALGSPQLREGAAHAGAGFDQAVAIGMRRDSPAFADLSFGDVVAKNGFETAPTPDLLVEDGLELNDLAQRRDGGHADSFCMTGS